MTVALVGYGIIIDDIVFPDGRTEMGVLGGGGPQTCWGMACASGDGTQVGIITGIGRDIDESYLEPLKRAHINMDGIRITSFPTTRTWNVLEHDGSRRHVWRVDDATIDDQLRRGYDPAYADATWFHWGIHPGDCEVDIQAALDLKSRGKRVSLEPYQPPDTPLSDEALQRLISVCDIFSPNHFEAAGIAGSEDLNIIAERFQKAGARILAVRRGAKGASVFDFMRNEVAHVGVVPANVIDPVGAGNAFCGALIARVYTGDSIGNAAAHASATASYLVEQIGMPRNGLPAASDYAKRLEIAQSTLKTSTL
ncbi:MAG: carbohydrate kinase family protein [Anaerolineae bacterium]|nr:carbohydrate kinase family protein [Anaerolineae bacterium]